MVSASGRSYWLTRVVTLKYLGFLYSIAFLVSWEQNSSLIGENGLTPATIYIQRLDKALSQRQPVQYETLSPIITSKRISDVLIRFMDKLLVVPTVFWFIEPSAVNISSVSEVGFTIALYVAIQGQANMVMLSLLWILYMSIVNIGQTWYSFGWESQLLETGFLAIFLVPLLSIQKYPRTLPCPWLCIFAYRWLLFRTMLGAGLIKIRGDSCWRDLTCMNYHYLTQPIPNPISPLLHSNSGEIMTELDIVSLYSSESYFV